MTLLWRKVLECSSSLLTSSSLWSHSLRHPCVLTHFVIPVSSLLWRKFLECSSSLLTSSSLWSHSYGGSIWSVLPHTTHFVIPVFSHPWLVFSPISSLSLTSLSSHLTQVIPDYSLPSLVLPLIPYSVFLYTPTLIALTQVISHSHSHHSSHTHSLIPAFSLTSLLWVLTPITCLLTLTISHRVSPHALSHPSHLCHHTEWSHITCVLRECLFPLPWCRTTTKSTLTLSSLSHTLPSMSSLWTLPWCRTITKSTHSLLWENLCSHSHSHGVVLPPSHHSHPHQSLCSHSHSHGVVLPPSVLSHTHSLLSHTLPLTLPWCRTTTKSSLTPTPILVLPLTSFHLILATNASQMHHQPSPTLSHPSCLHHIIITSSPLPITYHHQSLPLTPHNTPNPSISLPTLPIVS